jgi:hypothetical protein
MLSLSGRGASSSRVGGWLVWAVADMAGYGIGQGCVSVWQRMERARCTQQAVGNANKQENSHLLPTRTRPFISTCFLSQFLRATTACVAFFWRYQTLLALVGVRAEYGPDARLCFRD